MMNINDMIKQAQSAQQKMEEVRKEIFEKEYEGKSGGGLVSLTIKGDGHMKSISIDKSLMIEGDKAVLEDLIVAAFNDGKIKQEQHSHEAMSSAMGAIGLPAGIKLPL